MKWKTILDKEQRKYLNKLDVQTALRIVEKETSEKETRG